MTFSITAMDVKDAFLVVDQKEEMFVVIPRVDDKDSSRRCYSLASPESALPGQRNAALRWHEHLHRTCASEAGLEPYPGCPTVIMKVDNPDRRVFLSVHVDDILIPWVSLKMWNGSKKQLEAH